MEGKKRHNFLLQNFNFEECAGRAPKRRRVPAGNKRIEKDRNWGIGKDRTLLFLLTHHFESPKLYLFLSPHLFRVTENIYLFLSLCLIISIFSYPLVYPPTEVVSIFFSIFCDRPLVSFSIPHLSFHSANFYLSLYIPQYLFLPRNEECSSKKYCVHFITLIKK